MRCFLLIPPKCHTFTLYPYEVPEAREQRRNSQNRTTTKTTYTWNRYQFSALIRQLNVWIANEFAFINYSTFYPTFILCTYLHGLQCSSIHSIELVICANSTDSFFFSLSFSLVQNRNWREWESRSKKKWHETMWLFLDNSPLHLTAWIKSRGTGTVTKRKFTSASDCLIWFVFMESMWTIRMHASVPFRSSYSF